MRNLILFDDENREDLLPLTYTRPVCEVRVGILSIREKWEQDLTGKASYITNEYLSNKYPINILEDNLVINGSVMPNAQLIRLIAGLSPNEALMSDGDLVAARIPGDEFDSLIDGSFGDEISGYAIKQTPVKKLSKPWEVFQWCGEEIRRDVARLTRGRTSEPLSETNSVIGEHQVFLEEGATAEHVIFNTTKGPIWIGANAEVMEGSVLRGPVAVGEGAVIKVGAKIYGPSSFGPYCKVGGEVNNVSMQAYSNKGHDGFLGNSVIGEWCNLGADTNSSNLRNTYTPVKLYNFTSNQFEASDLLFCGLIMGDHSKAGINTMFNTGTVVGVSANIFGSDFPEKYIPSFSWGQKGNWSTFRLDKAFETAEAMMSRRDVALTAEDKEILKAIFEESAAHRSWER